MYSLSDGPNACSLEIMTSIKVVRVQLSCNDFLFARTLRDMQNHHMCLNSHDKKVLRFFALALHHIRSSSIFRENASSQIKTHLSTSDTHLKIISGLNALKDTRSVLM